MSDVNVIDRTDENRFVSESDGHLAELTYRVEGDRLHLDHTGVPEEIGGRGIAGALVRAAVERAVADRLVIVPHCPYAARWLEKHPDETSAVTVDQDAAESSDADESD